MTHGKRSDLPIFDPSTVLTLDRWRAPVLDAAKRYTSGDGTLLDQLVQLLSEQDHRRDKIAAGMIGVSVEEYVVRRDLGQKWCPGCRDWRPATAFGAHRGKRDGLQSYCVPCRAPHKGR